MKNLIGTSQSDVLNYWRQYEGIPNNQPVRADILHAGFPHDVSWYTAEIETADISSLYMISVHDLGPISENTWLISKATQNHLNGFSDDDHSNRIQTLLDQESFDPRLIIVAHAATGPFTIIDGNHRAIILHSRDELVGQSCFLGVHPKILEFDHAGMASRHLP